MAQECNLNLSDEVEDTVERAPNLTVLGTMEVLVYERAARVQLSIIGYKVKNKLEDGIAEPSSSL